MTESICNPLTLYLTRLAPSSQLTMRYVLQDAADRLGFEDINLEDIDWHLLQPEHVIALVAALREDGYAPNTSSLYVNAVRGVMNEAWRLNLISQEHLLRMRTVKAAPGTRLSQGRNLRRSLIREMMEVCAADPRPQGLRDAAVIGILYGSGMRKSESVNLDLAQINFEERSLRVIGKGNKERIVPLSEPTFVHLDAWCAVRGAEPGAVLAGFAPKGNLRLPLQPLTPEGVYKALKTLGSRCGVAVSPHDARRTRITDLLLGGLDPLGTQRFAGHANLATTELYDLRPAQRLADDVARIGSSLDPLPETP